MINKYLKISVILLTISFCLAFHSWIFAKEATLNSVNQVAKNWPHQANLFIKILINDHNQNAQNIEQTQQQYAKQTMALKQNFLHHFFLPWFNSTSLGRPQDFLAIEKEITSDYTHHPGWLENKQKNTSAAIRYIIKNMRLSAFPNFKLYAITISPANLRVLPTARPIFGNWHEAGQGFPFDNLQISVVKANSPVYILQVSQDGAWNLISNYDDTLGWVRSENLATVNNEFMQTWRSTKKFIVAIRDGRSLFDQHMHFYSKTRMGELFPLVSTSTHYYWVKLATRSPEGTAVTRIVRIRKEDSSLFPLPATPALIAQFVNKMLNIPYGWGELYGYRDCSATLRDLFSVFGIWLPRNSGEQAKSAGHLIDLSQLSRQKKESLIATQGVPFFTLLSIPGHIMLYLGQYRGDLWAFHNPWALHTINVQSGKPGRAIIGRSVITPLSLGTGYHNVKESFLDRVTGMTIIANPNSNSHQ